MTTQLQAGVAREEISPALGTPLMGYPDPHLERTAASLRDPLNATALALSQGDQAAILVSFDVTLLDDRIFDTLRDQISQATGVPREHITLSATHTHSAPRTLDVWGWSDIDWPYVNEILIPRAVAAATSAWSSLQPVRLGIGVTESHVGVNRRSIREDHLVWLGQNPWDIIDPVMTVLRFEAASGTLANVVHYGAHPTVLGKVSRAISRDWPGVMIDRMESLTGGTTLFINGALGDIAPRTNSGRAVGDATEAAMWEAGAAAGMDAMRAWRSIRDWRDPQLSVMVSDMSLPYRPLTPLDEARKNMAEFEPRKDEPGVAMAEYRHWQSVVEAHETSPKQAKAYRQTLTALGPVVLVPMPGEAFASIVLRVRELSPFAHTLCASATGGNNGYLCSRESLHRGGYEVWVGKAFGPYLLAENIDDMLVERNLKALRPLWDRIYPALPTD